MKRFKIDTFHEVYENNYIDGEGKNISVYTIKSEQEAEDLIGAIDKHFSNILGYSKFNKEYLQFETGDEYAYYSILVDVENTEVNEAITKQWREGKVKLYANNITVFASKLIKQKF